MGCGSSTKKTEESPQPIKISAEQFSGEIKKGFSEHYSVVRILGKGSRAKQYICAQRDTGISRAVRIVDKEALGSNLGRFLNEIAILRKIDHPNIIQLYDVFEDSKRYYVVTDLLYGPELLDRITAKKIFTENDAANIMEQILKGVAYCHSIKIVHRDIKPQNIMFESNEKDSLLKIIDFETSKFFDTSERSRMKVKVGTPYFMSPEVLYKSYTEKCDVWSCGVILYIMLCGYVPFDAPTHFLLFEKIKKGEYTMRGEAWDCVSDSAKDLVRLMLLKDQDKRISAKDALSHEWIKKYSRNEVTKEMKMEILTNIRKFNSQSKLQAAALTFMVSKLTTRSERKKLISIFSALDKDGTGRISKKELEEGYREVYGECVESDIEEVMKRLDFDQTGYITYTEFSIATIDKGALLTEDRLIAAFQTFDKDGSGRISIDEIKTILSGNDSIAEETWSEIVKEFDKDGTGEISQSEFVEMMNKMMESIPSATPSVQNFQLLSFT